jgi:predicted amidohydrolase
MARRLKIAAAQLGPIHLADDRPRVVRRLCALLREAHGTGAKLVVFPELALTTFFPRYWYQDIAEIDAWFESAMPNAATAPLFDLARELGVGFYLGYAELAQEGGASHRYNTTVLVGPDGRIIGKYRKVHLPGHADHRAGIPFQHLE